MISSSALWGKMRCYFFSYLIYSWEDLFQAIDKGFTVKLNINSS